MTITGIIAEFNPFHNGHQYLLDQIEGLKIVAMSGNFVQRGEPAVIDKWTRTQMALESGADLVVELPFLVAVQSADYFAKGAVEILAKLGIERLAFGTEERFDYQQLADRYGEKSAEMEAFLAELPEYLTYPQKTQVMWERFTGIHFSGDTPNHILGLAYAKACAGSGIKLFPIQRQGAGYHSTSKLETIVSATAIRQHISDADFVEKVMPRPHLLLSSPQVSWEDYWELLRYQLLTNSDLTAIFQVNAELASRLKAAVPAASSVADLLERVATKRYTKARIRRLLTYILVQAVEEPLPQAIHILGFSQKGQEHLKTIKHSVEIVSRIGARPWDKVTQQADAVYQLGNEQIGEQAYGRFPLSANL